MVRPVSGRIRPVPRRAVATAEASPGRVRARRAVRVHSGAAPRDRKVNAVVLKIAPLVGVPVVAQEAPIELDRGTPAEWAGESCLPANAHSGRADRALAD